MAKVLPNEPCPCGSGFKFKKCCSLYIKGKEIENAERLLRVRYSAYVSHDASFLWESSHPESPRRLKDTRVKFERELGLIKSLEYRGLTILDENLTRKDEAVIVYWVKVCEGEHDLSFLEEGVFRRFENKWHYFDGLRRSANRLGCLPESIRIGDLKTLFLHDSKFN